MTESPDIHEEICDFYRSLLGTTSSRLEAIDLNIVRVGPKLSTIACARLVQQVTTEEIDQALATIDDSRAPGLDGFNSVFFKTSWRVIKQDVCSLCKCFHA